MLRKETLVRRKERPGLELKYLDTIQGRHFVLITLVTSYEKTITEE